MSGICSAWHDELQMEAEAAERAALEKARAEQLDHASQGELLREGVQLCSEHGWTLKPPRKQK